MATRKEGQDVMAEGIENAKDTLHFPKNVGVKTEHPRVNEEARKALKEKYGYSDKCRD